MNISCNKCKEEKDSSHFHKNKRKKNGFEYTCKVCVKKRLEEIKIEKEEGNYIPRVERDIHKIPYGTLAYYRSSRLKRAHGIILSDYNKMFENQGGCCLICGKHQTDLNRPLCVDHNHKTGEIRDLLCSSCNSVLGYCYENIKILESAIKYIEKHNKKPTIGNFT